jgi:CRISPR-associated exonuclease Cas4
MFTEEQLLPLSALQHWLFCPRQCGLIHLEQVWAENKFSTEGHLIPHGWDDPFGESKWCDYKRQTA